MGFLGAPWAVKKYGVPELSKILNRPVMLRTIAFDPFAFNLKVEGFEIQETSSGDSSDDQPIFIDIGLLFIEQGAVEFRDESKSTNPVGPRCGDGSIRTEW